MSTQTKNAIVRGFTLIEVLVVVVVLGVVASLVIAEVGNASDGAQRTAFIQSGQRFVEAARRFQLDNGAYPENALPGEVPAGFEQYVNALYWTGQTPIGGVWDCASGQFGVASAVGVDFTSPGTVRNDAYMQQIDATIDDGDLSTGRFRKLAGRRYYFVVAD